MKRHHRHDDTCHRADGVPSGEKRDLVIDRAARGCMAPYVCVSLIDTVLVRALRSQMKAGCARNRPSSHIDRATGQEVANGPARIAS
jgi:hypothetical protein